MDLVLKESHQNTLKRHRLTRAMVIDEEAPSYPIVVLDTETPPQAVEESPEIGKESHRSAKASTKGKQLAMSKEPLEVPGTVAKKSKRKNIISRSSKGNQIVTEESEIALKELAANIRKQKEVEMALLNADRLGGEPGELLDLQKEDAALKSDNAALKKQLEYLTQQMLCDQRATNERIDKLLFKL
ncbi:hypothetical protein HAX54_025430 [Datura stramonium]|uniref:Uncharacterized protein n=1 Tax=Datura stramonium TaxID=4076 RepID=A0ABS8V056_DATST|nr:hypothetical protein [Datura stramonium]